VTALFKTSKASGAAKALVNLYDAGQLIPVTTKALVISIVHA
jgi:hypothetical protein